MWGLELCTCSEGTPDHSREEVVFRAVEQCQHLNLAQAFLACSCLRAFALTVVSAESCLSPDFYTAHSLTLFQDLRNVSPLEKPTCSLYLSDLLSLSLPL